MEIKQPIWKSRNSQSKAFDEYNQQLYEAGVLESWGSAQAAIFSIGSRIQIKGGIF